MLRFAGAARTEGGIVRQKNEKNGAQDSVRHAPIAGIACGRRNCRRGSYLGRAGLCRDWRKTLVRVVESAPSPARQDVSPYRSDRGGVDQSFCCAALHSPVTLPAHVSFSVFSARGARRFAHRFHFLRTPSPRRIARAAKGTSPPARRRRRKQRSARADAAPSRPRRRTFSRINSPNEIELGPNEKQRHGQTQIRSRRRRTSARMPPGVPYIIGNEAAERFYFYGMRSILIVFMTHYIWSTSPARSRRCMAERGAANTSHYFVSAVYFLPILGAILADGLAWQISNHLLALDCLLLWPFHPCA